MRFGTRNGVVKPVVYRGRTYPSIAAGVLAVLMVPRPRRLSDRDIARILGCSRSGVGHARRKLEARNIASPLAPLPT